MYVSRCDEPERIHLGFGDLYASTGDHIAHFYQDRDEWKNVLIPFLKMGLEAGEKCLCLVQPGDATQELIGAMRAAGVDMQQACASGQLVLDEGRNSPQEMQAFLQTALTDIPGEYPLLRWGADMTWSLPKIPTSHSLMEWETHCNTIGSVPAVFLCQYDLTQFMGSVVMDAFKTHPLCVISNVIHRNPYFVEPSIFLEELQSRAPAADISDRRL